MRREWIFFFKKKVFDACGTAADIDQFIRVSQGWETIARSERERERAKESDRALTSNEI